MQISSVRKGDLVEVAWKQGDHLVALVAEGAHKDAATGRRVIRLSDDPPRGLARPRRFTATAREVVTHWPLRGRKRAASPRPDQVEPVPND